MLPFPTTLILSTGCLNFDSDELPLITEFRLDHYYKTQQTDVPEAIPQSALLADDKLVLFLPLTLSLISPSAS